MFDCMMMFDSYKPKKIFRILYRYIVKIWTDYILVGFSTLKIAARLIYRKKFIAGLYSIHFSRFL